MKPPVFAALDLAEALAKSKVEKKLLLVDASAEWCGPCKHMDATTWVDPKVVDALRDETIVIQIDVDAKAEDAARLSVKAMPTVIAFTDGVEVDRVVGMQGPEQLLGWVDGLGRGETSLARFRRDVAAQPDNLEMRMELAQRLSDARDYEGATTEYLWIWKNMLEKDPYSIGVRHSILPAMLAELTAAHAPARTAFAEIRDAVAPRIDALEEEKLADWFSLNGALGEGAKNLAWYDAHTAEILAAKHVRKPVLAAIGPMLEEAQRFADLGRIYDDPLAEVRRWAATRDQVLAPAAGVPEEQIEPMRKFLLAKIQEATSLLTRSLRAAGRVDEAKTVEDEARQLGISDA